DVNAPPAAPLIVTAPSLSGIAGRLPATAVPLIGAGDIARCGSGGSVLTAQLLDSFPHAAVFTAGDNVDGDGSLKSYTDCYASSWGRAHDRTHPAAGDEEYVAKGDTGYFGYFGAAAGDTGKGYYSYDLGAWHVMVLNDNIAISAGSPQEQWLETELASNGKKCTLAYWNRPRFSSASGTHDDLKPLWDALYGHAVDVVVNAHDLVYERFAPQSPAGDPDPAHGVREFIIGTGGQGSAGSGNASANSEVRHSG